MDKKELEHWKERKKRLGHVVVVSLILAPLSFITGTAGAFFILLLPVLSLFALVCREYIEVFVEKKNKLRLIAAIMAFISTIVTLNDASILSYVLIIPFAALFAQAPLSELLASVAYRKWGTLFTTFWPWWNDSRRGELESNLFWLLVLAVLSFFYVMQVVGEKKRLQIKNAIQRIKIYVVVFVFLLLTAGIAFVLLEKFQQNVADLATGGWCCVQKSASAKLSIIQIWTNYTSTADCIANSNGTLSFIINNTGGYDYSNEDINKIAIYINGVFKSRLLNDTSTCSREVAGQGLPLNQNEIMVVTCGAWYKPNTTGVCPIVTVKISPPFGSGDEESYQYNSSIGSRVFDEDELKRIVWFSEGGTVGHTRTRCKNLCEALQNESSLEPLIKTDFFEPIEVKPKYPMDLPEIQRVCGSNNKCYCPSVSECTVNLNKSAPLPYKISMSQTADQINASVEILDYELQSLFYNNTNYTFVLLPGVPIVIADGVFVNNIPMRVGVDYNGTINKRLGEVSYTTVNQSLGKIFGPPLVYEVENKTYTIYDISKLPNETLRYKMVPRAVRWDIERKPSGFDIDLVLNPLFYDKETAAVILFKKTNIVVNMELLFLKEDEINMTRYAPFVAKGGDVIRSLLFLEDQGDVEAKVTCRDILPPVLVPVSGTTSQTLTLSPFGFTPYTYTANVQNVQGDQTYDIKTICNYTGPGNNQHILEQTSKITVYSPPNITVQRTAEAIVKSNRESEVSITVTNVGFTSIYNLTLYDTLPPEFTVTMGSTISAIAELEPSQSETLTYTFRAPTVLVPTEFTGLTTAFYDDLASDLYMTRPKWSVEVD